MHELPFFSVQQCAQQDHTEGCTAGLGKKLSTLCTKRVGLLAQTLKRKRRHGIGPLPATPLLAYTGHVGPRKTIFVVEDSLEDHELLQCLLKDCGFSVLFAVSGEQAAELLTVLDTSFQSVDLVLKDQWMANGAKRYR